MILSIFIHARKENIPRKRKYTKEKKIYQEKLFANFQLSDRVPKNNFYRRLHEVLDLDFLYKLTRPFYGESGQESIDPIVFFKLCLVRSFKEVFYP